MIKQLFLLILFFFSSISFGEESYIDNSVNKEVFLEDYQNNLDVIMSKFNITELPLHVKVFDISYKQNYDFLISSIGWKKNNEPMANIYYPNFIFLGKKTAFCFVLYDGDSSLVKNYMNLGLSYENTVQYLSYHEMGHCFENYLNQYQNKKNNISKKETELFADIFALLNFNNQSDQVAIQKILHLNEKLEKKDYHYYPEELMKAYYLINIDTKEKNLSENILLDKTRQIFYRIVNLK